jgi:ABC-type transport system involved in cytochrome bd biosynthesis fused ATPase/permease subunit
MKMNNNPINWYPGHMAKTKRLIKEKYNLIDIVYEVIDARMPKSSKIVDIDDLIKNKPRLLIMTKYDLCDKKETDKFISYYENLGYQVISVDLMSGTNVKKIIEASEVVLESENEKRKAKGLKPRNIRALILGVPNAGKSTLINCIANNLKYNGEITFAGHQINPADFIKISQRIWLFQGTVSENLSLLQNIPDDLMLHEAKKMGLIHEFGNDFLDKLISDDANNLSGGQAQRLALVRGLIRSKKIYLLDEICSSLDPKNSDAIHKIIYQLPAIVIEIAHNYNPQLAQENKVQVYKLIDAKLQKQNYIEQ